MKKLCLALVAVLALSGISEAKASLGLFAREDTVPHGGDCEENGDCDQSTNETKDGGEESTDSEKNPQS